MNDAYSVTANFAKQRYDLTTSSTAGGSVSAPAEGTYTYNTGTIVSLVASANTGCHLTNWTGDLGTIGNVKAISSNIVMSGDYSVTANFEEIVPSPGACFIATAAHGTPMAEEIQVLREFRDQYVLTGSVGRAFVDFYYRASPAIAESIGENPSLKPIVRAGLLAAVGVSTVAVKATPAGKMVIVGLLVLVSIALAVWIMRRRASADHPDSI